MLRLIALLGSLSLALLLSLLVAHPAWADTPATTVSLSPLYIAIEPFLLAIITACAPVALTLLWQYLSTRNKILQTQQVQDAEAKAQQVFQTALSNAAGRWLASQEGNVANLKVDVHSPGIAAEINTVQNLIPGTLNQIGVTPANVGAVVANGVLAKIGQLQAVASAGTTATTVQGDQAALIVHGADSSEVKQ